VLEAKNDHGFTYEYTYQDCEYIIRTMNTIHAQCTVISSTCNQTLYTWFTCSRLQVRLHSVILSTFVIKMLRQC